MAKTLRGLQTNFTAGELSPRLWGHVDIAKYKNGIKTGLNTYCLPHGPIVRRSGTGLINEVKDSSKEVRLVRFQFNQENAFILEFGHLYIRFYKDGGRLTSGVAITNGNLTTDATGWTDGSSGTGVASWSAGTLVLNGQGAGVGARYQTLSSVSMAQHTLTFTVATNTLVYKIGTSIGGTEIATGTGALGVNNINFTPTTGGPIYIYFSNANNNNAVLDTVSITDPIYQITTTYTEAEVQELTYVQFGRILYIAHGSHAPTTLSFNDETDWTLETIFFYPPPTDEAGFKPVATITPSAATGLGITFTASAGVFLAADVGRQIHNLAGAGTASIVSYTSTTVVICDILEDFPNTNAIVSQSWKLDLSPIAKLEVDNSGTGTTCTATSFYTDSFRGPALAISTISVANPGVVTTSASHGLTDGDKVELKNIGGMSQLNNTIWGVNVTAATTFTLLSTTGAEVDTTLYQAYTGSGTARKVFSDLNIAAFRSSDVDRYILINGGIGLITAVTNSNTIKMELQKSLNSLTSTSAWSNEQEAWTSTAGYPRIVALHQQRIWFGGTEDKPQTIWGSSPAIFDAMGTGSLDDDAVQFDLASAEVNQIQWMYGLRDNLIVGTSGAEVTVGSGVQAGPITPSSVTADSRTYSGSKLQQPIALENEVLYIQRSGTKINSFRYNFEIDNFLSDDLAFLAEHMPRHGDGIKEIAYAQDPDRLIYAVLNDGTMMVGTYYRDQQVIAWTLYETQGLFENVQTISTGLNDEVWVVVKRTINGSTKRYVERFDSTNMADFGDSNIEMFSDCGLSIDLPLTITGITKANPGVVTSAAHGLSNGDFVKMFDVGGMAEVIGKAYKVANVATNTFELTDVDGVNINTTGFTTYTSGGSLFKLFTSVSGLDHLEGKIVEIKADGGFHAAKTVSSGAITLDRRCYNVTVGLGYDMDITTLKREFDVGLGSQQGQIARHVHPILRVYKSALPLLNDEFLPARAGDDVMDSKVNLTTGDIEYGSLTWSTDTELTLTLSKPFPFVLLGIYGVMEAGIK